MVSGISWIGRRTKPPILRVALAFRIRETCLIAAIRDVIRVGITPAASEFIAAVSSACLMVLFTAAPGQAEAEQEQESHRIGRTEREAEEHIP